MIHTVDVNFLGYPEAIASFAIETSEGLALVETGPYSSYNNLVSGLQEKGFSPDDVKHVFLTHIHLDHAGAAWAFAERGAKVYVHPVGYPHLNDPSKLMHSASRIYGDQMERLWSDMNPIAEDRLQAVENGQEIALGDQVFKAWHTPGHASHHIAWQLGDVLFTGDVAGVKIKSGIIEPPCPPPDIDVEAWKNSIANMRKINPSAFYLTHFGKVEDTETHLNQLEHYLDSWVAWMRPHYEKGESVEEITPQFQEFVAGQFREAGVDMQVFETYEAANPAWMSVTGLLRYWKKKLNPRKQEGSR